MSWGRVPKCHGTGEDQHREQNQANVIPESRVGVLVLLVCHFTFSATTSGLAVRLAQVINTLRQPGKPNRRSIRLTP